MDLILATKFIPLEAAIAKDQICELGGVTVDRLIYCQNALMIAICF